MIAVVPGVQVRFKVAEDWRKLSREERLHHVPHGEALSNIALPDEHEVNLDASTWESKAAFGAAVKQRLLQDGTPPFQVPIYHWY